MIQIPESATVVRMVSNLDSATRKLICENGEQSRICNRRVYLWERGAI